MPPPPTAVTDAARTTSMPARGGLGRVELTALLAMCMALTALGIDLMLPAFADIRADLGLRRVRPRPPASSPPTCSGWPPDSSRTVRSTDRFGRKRALQVGFGVYAVAALAEHPGTGPALR